MHKMPVILTLKNARHHYLVAEMSDGAHTPEEFDDEVLAQLPETLKRDQVVKVTCFCHRCQDKFAMTMNRAFSFLELNVTDIWPLAAMKEIVPILEGESTLTEGWSFFSHLIDAAAAASPHIKLAQVAANEYIEVNKD